MPEEKAVEVTAEAMSCPMPKSDYKNVLLAHGGGGRLTRRLIERMFVPLFRNEYLSPLHDGAVLPVGGSRVAFTTDSYVVHPIRFPGGDIGSLAVNGTINDLAMCGATPLALSAAFIIEEGFSMQELLEVTVSMREAALAAGVPLVTGDTKVVDRGKGDKIYVNTSGIGIVPPGIEIRPDRVSAGDKIVISGEIARHGIAILSVREGIGFENPVSSDTAPLHGLAGAMLAVCPDLHVMRDATRGGVAAVLNEIAQAAGIGVSIREDRFIVGDDVRGACEVLGLDPLYVANEGVLVAFVPAADCDRVLSAMRAHPMGRKAAVIGEAVADNPGRVVMKSRIGGMRMVEMLSGEQLPRIC